MDFPGDSVVKTLPASAEDKGLSLGWDDPLEKEMALHSTPVFLWESPWTEESAEL